MSFAVIPAIDLRAGQVVRLRQGDYAQQTSYRVERATGRLAGAIVASGLFVGGVLLRINTFAAEARWAWAAAALVAIWTLWPRGER